MFIESFKLHIENYTEESKEQLITMPNLWNLWDWRGNSWTKHIRKLKNNAKTKSMNLSEKVNWIIIRNRIIIKVNDNKLVRIYQIMASLEDW